MHRRIVQAIGAILLLAVVGGSAAAFTTNATGVDGYDLVSYHQGAKPIRGNGNHASFHDGVMYLFASADNKKTFDANPGKYLPAYGGYCAYGVSVGKKFHGDPDVWKLVDGKLYLNLDTKIQALWQKDVPGNIRKANGEWKEIRDRAPQDL